MRIELFSDGLDRRDRNKFKPRVATRAIIRREDKYLILYLANPDIYMFPGGGVEKGESLESCLKREILEETGYTLSSITKKVTLAEYFIDSTWENTYFACEIDESIERAAPILTPQEQSDGEFQYLWLSDSELLDLLDTYESANASNLNIHEREFIGFINSF